MSSWWRRRWWWTGGGGGGGRCRGGRTVLIRWETCGTSFLASSPSVGMSGQPKRSFTDSSLPVFRSVAVRFAPSCPNETMVLELEVISISMLSAALARIVAAAGLRVTSSRAHA